MTYTHKIEFGFGAELDRSGARIKTETRQQAIDAIRQTATELFGGCTMVETWGCWKSPEGQLFRERGATLIVYMGFSPMFTSGLSLTVRAMAQTIKDTLNQQAVAVIVIPLSFAEMI